MRGLDRFAAIASIIGLAISIISWFLSDWRTASLVLAAFILLLAILYLSHFALRNLKKLLIAQVKEILIDGVNEQTGTKTKMGWNEFYSLVDNLAFQLVEEQNWAPDLMIAMDGGGVTVAGQLLEVYRFHFTPPKIVQLFNPRILLRKNEGEGQSKGTTELRRDPDKGSGVGFHPESPQLPDLAGMNVLIVDSLVVSGATLAFMREEILNKGAREVKTAVAVQKIDVKPLLKPNFVGGRSNKELPRDFL